ncbi:MAG: O-antigen ligase family protein [Candidatus Omnitrophota bacterium]
MQLEKIVNGFYLLSLITAVLAVMTIGHQIHSWILVAFFAALGGIAVYLKDQPVPLFLFLFLLPFINASPSLFHNPYPYNYSAPALFLLGGILIGDFLKNRRKPGTPLIGQATIDRNFIVYYLFLSILFVSAVFVFLRWSNITLGNMAAVGADTPVSPPVPRILPGGHVHLIDQRVSFASIFPIITLFLYFISPYIFFYIRKLNPGETVIFKWLSLGFYISTAWAFIQKLSGYSPLSDRIGKGLKQFNGGFSDFNAFGVFAGILFLWSTYEIRKKNLLGYITFGVSLIGGILSGSRTMFVFAAAGMLNLLVHASQNQGKRQRLIAAILIAVFIVGIIAAGGTLKKRLMGADWDKKETLFDKADAVVNGRLTMAAFSFDILRHYPVSGIGTGNYTFYLAYKQYPTFQQTGKPYLYDLPLNQYLWVWVENGLIAGLFYLFFMIQLYRRSSQKLFTGTMLGVLLFNNYLWFPETCVLFWIVAALTYQPTASESVPVKWKWAKARWGVAVASIFMAILFNIFSFHSLLPKNWMQQTGIPYDYGVWGRETDAEGKEFQWTNERAGVFLTLNQNGESEPFKVVCSAPFDRLKLRQQTVQFYWKRKRQHQITFSGNGSYDYRVKGAPGEQGFFEVTVSPTFTLEKLSHGKDSRTLGVCLYAPKPTD